MNAPAPTWRTHDWCITCGMSLNRNCHGSRERIFRHHDWGHAVVAQQDSWQRDLPRAYTPTQRAAFEAWAKGDA